MCWGRMGLILFVQQWIWGPSFLSASLVYYSIRSTYSPEHGPGLNIWTEWIIVYASITTLPWSAVLDYIIAYFQEHQSDPPAYWYRSDTELILLYLSLAHAQIVNTLNTSSGSSKARKPICNNYNRPVDACKNGNDHGVRIQPSVKPKTTPRPFSLQNTSFNISSIRSTRIISSMTHALTSMNHYHWRLKPPPFPIGFGEIGGGLRHQW
jgi:hypothetical protein